MLSKNISQNLYSVNAYIAYIIAENYFDGNHFVWCAPVFNPKDCDDLDINKKIPYSSSPHGIFSLLNEEINSGDLHSSKIQGIKAGLNKGAGIKLAAGVINDSQYGRIIDIIQDAQLIDFRPLIYVINKSLIDEKRILKVSVKDSANPLSTEFQIHDLVRTEFDILKI